MATLGSSLREAWDSECVVVFLRDMWTEMICLFCLLLTFLSKRVRGEGTVKLKNLAQRRKSFSRLKNILFIQVVVVKDLTLSRFRR